MDYIPIPYIATMRWANGVTSQVQWLFTDPDATVVELATPYRSGHFTPDNPFDFGWVGEIPTPTLEKSTIARPSWLCTNCRAGEDDWWGPDGWPDGTPGVVLYQGFAAECNDMPPVTYVALDMPPEFTVTGSPVTSSGTFEVAKATQAFGTVWAGPVSGSPAAPSFRPLVPTDLGTGSPSSANFLRGDGAWAAATPAWMEAGLYWPAGTPLVSLNPLGPYSIAAGDLILTWDGSDSTTWGIWVASAGAWTRSPQLPAGQVVTGPAWIWVYDTGPDLNGEQALLQISPPPDFHTTYPFTWTVGVDGVESGYAVPLTLTGAGGFLTYSDVYLGRNIFLRTIVGGNVPYTAVTPGYPASDLGPGTLPPTVSLPPSQLATPGVIPSGVTIPATQVTGLPASPLFQLETTFPAPASYTPIINLAGTTGIIGQITVRGDGTGNGFTVRVTVTDFLGNTNINIEGFSPSGAAGWGVLVLSTNTLPGISFPLWPPVKDLLIEVQLTPGSGPPTNVTVGATLTT